MYAASQSKRPMRPGGVIDSYCKSFCRWPRRGHCTGKEVSGWNRAPLRSTGTGVYAQPLLCTRPLSTVSTLIAYTVEKGYNPLFNTRLRQIITAPDPSYQGVIRALGRYCPSNLLSQSELSVPETNDFQPLFIPGSIISKGNRSPG